MVGAVLITGCAGRAVPLDPYFVRHGKPAMDYGKLPVAAPQPVDEGAGAPKPVSAIPASDVPHGIRPASLGTTVEATDQRLAAALLVEATAPTVDHHLRVAEEYLRLGILDAAETRLQRAAKLDPRRADVQEALARLWRDWGQPDRALGPAYRAVRNAPASASAVNTLGTVFGSMNRWSDAAQQFARAGTMTPDAAWPLSNLCYAEFVGGLLEDARSHCESALLLDATLSAAHNNLGLVLAATGDFAGAYTQFLAAGGQGSAEYNTGIVRAAGEEYEAAAEAFERAIRARPDFTEAKARAHQARVHALTPSATKVTGTP